MPWPDAAHCLDHGSEDDQGDPGVRGTEGAAAVGAKTGADREAGIGCAPRRIKGEAMGRLAPSGNVGEAVGQK